MAGMAEREVIRYMEVLEKAELEAVVALLAFFNDASEQLSASKQPTSFLAGCIMAALTAEAAMTADSTCVTSKCTRKMCDG